MSFPSSSSGKRNRWVPTATSVIQPPHYGPFVRPGSWNHTCIQCHTTGAQPGYHWETSEDPGQENALTMYSQAAEFGISCEACHGPGERHVAEHQRENPPSDPAEQLVVPTELAVELSSEVCGQCHAVFQFKTDADFVHWSQHGSRFRPGDALEEGDRWLLRASSTNPTVQTLLEEHPRESVLWPDGMVRVSGREYSGMIESPCFQQGQRDRKLTCFSCHTMHAEGYTEEEWPQWADDQLKPGMRTNQACLQCHENYAGPEALAGHTHHAPDSSGSNCYNCHMGYTTYGLLKAMRSHQIDSPSVKVSQQTGRPNACNQCHLDQTLKWTADHLHEWYDVDPVPLSEDEQQVAASILWTLQGNAGQRALMAWSMGWPAARDVSETSWMTPYLAQLLDDPYHAIRIIANRSLRQASAFQDLDYDPVAHPDDRQPGFAELLRRHRERLNEGPLERSGPRLLMDAAGELDRAKFKQLLDARDDTDLTLKE